MRSRLIEHLFFFPAVQSAMPVTLRLTAERILQNIWVGFYRTSVDSTDHLFSTAVQRVSKVRVCVK